MFETERLILRKLTKKDADEIFVLRSDAEVMRFIRAPQNRTESGNWIRLVSNRWKDEQIGVCGVIEKSSKKLIGWCGLWRLVENGETEVAYAINKNFRRRGFATEAAAGFLRYGFDDLNLDKIVAVALPENTASCRVMEKLGMHYDGIGKFYDRDLAHYSISKTNWQSQVIRDS